MSDRIRLTGISATACHGVLEHEKVQPQPFLVDIDVDCDLARAGRTDQLQWTINYAQIAQAAHGILTGPPVDLIEHLAERIAAETLTHPAAEAVEVTVHKPQAPAGVPFHDPVMGGPSVTVRRSREVPVVIAAGANLGDRTATLRTAIAQLGEVDGVDVVSVAPAVETDPIGGPEQPDYLNTVILARTRLAPWTILDHLHRIERWQLRTREVRWGARTLDLDLIQYGEPGEADEVRLDTDELTLPHPRAHERAFVLVPWHSIDPGARLRTRDDVRSVSDLLAGVADQGVRPAAGGSELR